MHVRKCSVCGTEEMVTHDLVTTVTGSGVSNACSLCGYAENEVSFQDLINQEFALTNSARTAAVLRGIGYSCLAILNRESLPAAR